MLTGALSPNVGIVSSPILAFTFRLLDPLGELELQGLTVACGRPFWLWGTVRPPIKRLTALGRLAFICLPRQ